MDKLFRGVVAAIGFAAVWAVAPGSRAADLANLPEIIFESGVENWRMDRIAGNTMAGTWVSQGPALEVGGLSYPQRVVEAGDGTLYIASSHARGGDVPRLFKLDPATGVLRVFMEPEGLVEGPLGDCQAGVPAWNAYENTLYLTGPNCLRRIVVKPDGTPWVEVVAGVPNTPGSADGPALSATLQSPRGLVCTSNGACYWLEDNAVRKIYGGTVTTLPLTRPETPGYLFYLNPGYNLLSRGEDDNTLYISDYYGRYGYGVLKCDLTTNELTRVVGIPKGQDPYGRIGAETDGPALTHVGFVAGARGLYDPFYNAIWVGGADHHRFRWLRLDGDGWVRTVFGALRPDTAKESVTLDFLNSAGIAAEQFTDDVIGLTYVLGVDRAGGVYVIGWRVKDGLWRAYDVTEVQP